MVQSKTPGLPVNELSRDDGYEMLNELSQEYLNISADDFISGWNAGKFDDDVDNPKIVRLAMLLPFVRNGR